MQSFCQQVSRMPKWCLILLTVATLAIVIMAVPIGLVPHPLVIYGQFKEHQEGEDLAELTPYLYFFPKKGKHFSYWCRPSSHDVGGSYEIAESDFVKWAHDNGWGLAEVNKEPTFGIVQVLEPNNQSTFVSVRDGLYYCKQVLKESESVKFGNRQLESEIRIVFDREQQKVYFSVVQE